MRKTFRSPRARRAPDAGRLANTASRPGIDPRTWVTLAVVEELGYDPTAGVFADVLFLPSGEPETCYVGVPYAGNVGGTAGFGSWWPLEVGDTVVVVVPGGDTGAGPVIVCRLWNAGDPPPAPSDLDWAAGAASLEPPTDVVIRAKPGAAIKIRTQTADVDIQVEATGDLKLTNIGAGNVTIEALGAGKVQLGVAATAQAVALAPLITAMLTTLQAAVAAAAVTPGDGGAALKSALATALTAAANTPIGATKTEAT